MAQAPVILAAALAALLPAAARAQAETPPAKLAEWPKLPDSDKERVLGLVGQLRKPDAKLQERAREQLVKLGDAAAPLLLQQVSDRDEALNSELFGIFDRVLGPQHGALLARECKKPKVDLRRYLVRRLCRFADPALLPVLQAASKDADEVTAFCGSLGCLVLQQREALPAVLAYTKTHWREQGELVAEVLPKARSNAAGSWVFEAIAKAPVADQMAGLRLARYLAVADHKVILRGYLDAPDHTVLKEAVNALRVMHGEAPVENLPVFRVIEMAKEWKAKA